MQDGDLNLVHKAPGQLLARGVCRHLHSLNYACVEEFTPERGKRVDIMALGPKGQIWVIECKSSRADFNADHKWQGYLEWCDRFFWAVNEAFPSELLPIETGLIIADSYGAEVIRMPDEQKLSPARRKALTQRFARQAALRLQGMRDPQL
ncbi:MAG: MmcB family DNA repair protein [Pseudomonadota bacterium]